MIIKKKKKKKKTTTKNKNNNNKKKTTTTKKNSFNLSLYQCETQDPTHSACSYFCSFSLYIYRKLENNVIDFVNSKGSSLFMHFAIRYYYYYLFFFFSHNVMPNINESCYEKHARTAKTGQPAHFHSLIKNSDVCK